MANQPKKKVEEVKVEKSVKKSPAITHENDKSLKSHAMKYADARFARQAAVSICLFVKGP